MSNYSTYNIQARLQSRISIRSSVITDLLEDIKTLKGAERAPIMGSYLVGLKATLRRVEADQKLDKVLLSSIYWGGM